MIVPILLGIGAVGLAQLVLGEDEPAADKSAEVQTRRVTGKRRKAESAQEAYERATREAEAKHKLEMSAFKAGLRAGKKKDAEISAPKDNEPKNEDSDDE